MYRVSFAFNLAHLAAHRLPRRQLQYDDDNNHRTYANRSAHEAHTSSLPFRSHQPLNWQLSSQRSFSLLNLVCFFFILIHTHTQTHTHCRPDDPYIYASCLEMQAFNIFAQLGLYFFFGFSPSRQELMLCTTQFFNSFL